MDSIAAYEEFRRLKDHHPFHSFEVETVDGKMFSIRRRSGFAVNRKSIVLGDAEDRARFYRHGDVKVIRATTQRVVTS